MPWAMVGAALIAAIFLWRPIAALACDDLGNLALLKSDVSGARTWFERGLRVAPSSATLLEDRGRARLAGDPEGALADFEAAGCGTPCVAKAGDARLHTGDVAGALDDFVRARAFRQLDAAAQSLAAAERFDEAITAEQLMVAQLGADPLDRGPLAEASWRLGTLEIDKARRDPQQARGLRADAVSDFARASALAPYNDTYLLALGFGQLDEGDRAGARVTFERLLRIHPDQPAALRALQTIEHDVLKPQARG